jgi:hypothetical protein
MRTAFWQCTPRRLLSEPWKSRLRTKQLACYVRSHALRCPHGFNRFPNTVMNTRLLLALIFSTSLPVCWLRAQTPGATVAGTEMARCLEIMRDPTLENAVSAARQLQQLAGTQQREAKAATDKLALRRLKQRLRDVLRGTERGFPLFRSVPRCQAQYSRNSPPIIAPSCQLCFPGAK